MVFSSIVISLLLERFLQHIDDYRQHHWFKGYANWIAERSFHQETFTRNTGLAVLIVPLVLVTFWVQGIFDSGLFGLAFNILVLLLCLGPVDLDQQVNAYIDAQENEENADREDLITQLLGEGHDKDSSLARPLAQQILIEAGNRIFGVLFWFLLAGPAGAVAYRATHRLLDQTSDTRGVQLLLNILNWAPARLTALAYAISGSLDDALQGWRQNQLLLNQFPDNDSAAVLAGAGLGALQLGETADEEFPPPEVAAARALNLVWRATLVWVGAIALLYLIG